jgi:phosphatidyl-myo-inositol alpha-mannosyltransferase
MRIGLVTPYNVFVGGAVKECVLGIRNELIKRGHEVWIITPRPLRSKGKKAPENTIFIGRAITVKSFFRTTAQVSATVDNESIDEMLKERNFDVLHFHEPWVPFVGRQILARSDVKNIATFHAKLPDSRFNKTIEKVITPYTKSILKSLDCLTAVSEPAAEYVKSLTSRSIKCVPNGVDIDKYSRPAKSKKLENRGKNVLFIGRLEARKGVNHLLEAYRVLSEQDSEVSLDIAGSGPDEKKLRKLAEDLDLNRVTFHGLVSEEKKIELMHTSRVFCSPALYGESFGIVLLEAMSAGIPTVAGNNPGYVSVMQGKGAISIVDPKDSSAFARTLKLLLEDEEVRSLWQDWAKSYVKNFSYETVVSQYESLYHNVAGIKKSESLKRELNKLVESEAEKIKSSERQKQIVNKGL